MNSYTSQRTGPSTLLREAFSLYRNRSRDIPGQVAAIIRNLSSIEDRIKKQCGLEMRDLDVLDIGAGQMLAQAMFFSRFNRVVAIDWDVIAQGFSPRQYMAMLAANGPRRTAKTLGRKLLGIDRRYRAEVMRQLNLAQMPRIEVHRMDACKMSFRDESFDLVHSRSVFHHLPDPAAGVNEVVRVLKPGGVAYIDLHLFTSETGSLDPKVYMDENGEVARWPHLRPQYAGKIRSNAFLNKLRLGEWCELFKSGMPGATVIANPRLRPGLEADARSLMKRGELAEYSLEEILAQDVVVLWRKGRGP